jgi:hypothetical protein
MRLKVTGAMKTNIMGFCSLVVTTFMLKMVAICSSEILGTSYQII